jgi:hypothetical protein
MKVDVDFTQQNSGLEESVRTPSRMQAKRRAWVLLFALLAVAAAGARVLQFWRVHSLMLDECAVCMNILDRGPAGLVKALDYDQAAPLGYLFLQKAVFAGLGMSDLSVRVVPLFFGLAAIPLAAIIVVWLFPPRTKMAPALLAFGLISLNRGLAVYSGISKQYTLECVCTLLLLLALFMAIGQNDGPAASGWKAWLLIVSPLLVWLSYGAVFVIAGIVAALLARAVFTRQRRAVNLALRFTLCAAPNLLLFFLFSARGALGNQTLSGLWSQGYLPLWPPVQTIKWLYQAFIAVGENVIHLRLAFLLPLGLVLTAAYAVRRRAWFWLACAMAVLACLGASALGRYPFSGRLLLFLVPIFVLMLAKAVDLLGQYSNMAAVAATALMLVVASIPFIGQVVLRDSSIDQVRVVHKALLAKVEPGDQIWVAPYSVPCLRYYSLQYPFPSNVGLHALATNGLPALQHGRNWMLVMRTPWSPGEGERLIEYAGTKGTPGSSFDVELTTARLFTVP